MSENNENPTNEEVAVEVAEVEVAEEQPQVADDQPEAIEDAQDEATSIDSNKVAIPDFKAGDTLRLGVRIKEGDKVRIQYFEGIVLARKGAGVNKTFTIRKIGAGGIAVERIFPLYSPSIASFEVRRRGVTRRAKIYFLRDIVGSTANVIKERKIVRDRTEAKAAKAEKKAARVAKRAEQAASKPANDKKSTRSARRAGKKSS